MAFFNPFPEFPATQLTDEDMKSLISNGVAEGYVIEYKSALPDNLKIAKSIASFANTYGGWYFVGISTDELNVAKDLTGISSSDDHRALDRVRDVIMSSISPVPLVHSQIVRLGNGRSILAIRIPEGQDLPYFCIDGRVYRRSQDSSNPVLENDRYTVDRLVDRGRRSRKVFASFSKDTRQFSEADSKSPWIVFYASPYPEGSASIDLPFSEDSVRQYLERWSSGVNPFGDLSSAALNVSMPFKYAQTTIASLILKNSATPVLHQLSAGVEIFVDGSIKMYIPLKLVELWDSSRLPALGFDPSVIDVLSQLRSQDRDHSLHLLRPVDVSSSWLAIAVMFSKYREFLLNVGSSLSVRLSFEIQDTWRLVPFYNAGEWASYV